jgi:hypothetical protein
MKRAPKELVEARVLDLLRIILDGAEEGWDLCEFVREKEAEAGSSWHLAEGDKPLSYSQIRRYAARAERLIAASCRAQGKKLLRRHLARRRNLYAKATLAGDYRAALAALRDEAELLGLYPAKGVAVAGRNGGPIVLNVVEEVVHRQAAPALNVIEEVVSAPTGRTNGTGPGEAPPGPA